MKRGTIPSSSQASSPCMIAFDSLYGVFLEPGITKSVCWIIEVMTRHAH